jgi:hypothetical protein
MDEAVATIKSSANSWNSENFLRGKTRVETAIAISTQVLALIYSFGLVKY